MSFNHPDNNTPPPLPPQGFPAPPQSPVEPPKQTGRTLLAIAAFVALCAILAGVVLLVAWQVSRDDQATVEVEYSLEVFTYDLCSQFANVGYGDIPGTDVEVFNAEGTLLGFGTLDFGQDTPDSCIFRDSFEVNESDDGVYRITVGAERGFVNYNEGHVHDGVLIAIEYIEG